MDPAGKRIMVLTLCAANDVPYLDTKNLRCLLVMNQELASNVRPFLDRVRRLSLLKQGATAQSAWLQRHYQDTTALLAQLVTMVHKTKGEVRTIRAAINMEELRSLFRSECCLRLVSRYLERSLDATTIRLSTKRTIAQLLLLGTFFAVLISLTTLVAFLPTIVEAIREKSCDEADSKTVHLCQGLLAILSLAYVRKSLQALEDALFRRAVQEVNNELEQLRSQIESLVPLTVYSEAAASILLRNLREDPFAIPFHWLHRLELGLWGGFRGPVRSLEHYEDEDIDLHVNSPPNVWQAKFSSSTLSASQLVEGGDGLMLRRIDRIRSLIVSHTPGVIRRALGDMEHVVTHLGSENWELLHELGIDPRLLIRERATLAATVIGRPSAHPGQAALDAMDSHVRNALYFQEQLPPFWRADQEIMETRAALKAAAVAVDHLQRARHTLAQQFRSLCDDSQAKE